MPSARFCSTNAGMSLAWHQMDVDVLFLGAAAAPIAHAMGAHQRETLRQHPRRRVKIAEPLDPISGEAGLLLELLDRRVLDGRVRVLVADQPGGKLEAAAARPRSAAGRPGSPCLRTRRE